MEHSKMFDKIKRYYDEGLWTKKMVRNAVKRNQITPEEYFEIVGEPYE